MRICLINPPSPFLLDDRVFAPLGLLQVAAVLEEAGHDVVVADLGGMQDYLGELRKFTDIGYDVYGVTATTPQFPVAVDALRYIREADPGKRVIIGGPHATVMPESCRMFDCVVAGDGELAVLDAISGQVAFVDAASSTTKGTLRWHWPSRHLIDMDSYKYSLAGRRGTSMMLSQGCPYSCSFCCGRLNPYYRRVRSRDVDDVIREMEHLVDVYGVGALMAFDDEVNLLNEPLIEFCKRVKPLGLKFRAFVKANLFNDCQAEAMAEAGFVNLCTGVEAGSDRILAIIDKQTTRVINKRFVDLCRKHGMTSKCFMSMGHPSESHESVSELEDWLLWARPDDFDVTVISVYPGTPIWAGRQHIGFTEHGTPICRFTKSSRNPLEDGATLFFEEVDYSKEFVFYKGRPKEYISHVWTPDLSKEDLVRLRDHVEDEVRKELGIPYPRRYSGDYLDGQQNFEHTMGAGVTPQDSRVKLREG